MVQSIHYQDAEALKTLVSENLGPWSNNVKVTQEMINQFAELSDDHTWLHVDVERCKKESPFKSTIAHGFLLLSMISRFKNCLPDVTTLVTGYRHMMNYGSDKLRFVGAVPVDSELHARSRIKEIEVSGKKTKMTTETHIHIVGQESAALIYEMTFVFL